MSVDEVVRQPEDETELLRERNAGLVRQNAALGQLVQALGEQVTGLRGQLATAEQQVTELREQLALSEERIVELERGKQGPPSFIKPNRPKREGAKAARRPRAKEHNRGRKRAETVTRREEHHMEHCPECEGKLRHALVAWCREVIDLPAPAAVEVTEHVVFKGYCPRCAGWKYAEACAPEQVVGQRRFGARLMALIGYLSEELRLPYEAIRHYLQTIHGLEVSVGALADLRHGLAQTLQPVADELKAQIRDSAIVHSDETGWREDGQNGYVWVFSTPGEQGIRCYIFSHSRDQSVVQAVLGAEFEGVLGSDFYGAYHVYRGRHQRCWVHLLRDLHALKDNHPADDTVQAWAQELRTLYDRAQAFVKAGPHSQEEQEQLYVALVSEIERLGLIYARAKHPCRALAKRILRHQDELFQFVLVAGLAADNNLAERSLRPLVVVRKISGGTRSPRGSQTRMTLASIFATLKARGLNPFTAILALIRANS
jgi:transposase